MSICRWPWLLWNAVRHRAWKWRWQMMARGYSDVDVWNLFVYITRCTLPILRQFRANHHGYIEELGEEGWDNALDEMIAAFEEIDRTDGHPGDRMDALTGEYWFDRDALKRTREGLRLFGEYFLDLWD